MSTVFNADEIYQIGIEIEKNGKKFYDMARDITDEPETKKLFSDLAKWEDTHVSIFEKLRRDLPEKLSQDTVFDPNNELFLYMKAAADSHVFLANKDVASFFDSCNGPVDILKVAITFEKDSVVLYTSMKNLVPEDLGRDKVNRLANEEVAHVSFLQKQLSILE